MLKIMMNLCILQHDKKFETIVRAMTIDKLFGGSSLKKDYL